MSSGILTKEVVEKAVDILRPCIKEFLRSHTKRQHLAIVVTAVEAINPPDPLRVSFKERCYLVDAIGDSDERLDTYTTVALSKAEMSVRTGKGTHELQPQYRRTGDTLYSGSVVTNGIVVACSGVQGYFDEAIAGMIAAMIQGLCKHKFAQIPEAIDFVG